jgi:hypothetical protein
MTKIFRIVRRRSRALRLIFPPKGASRVRRNFDHHAGVVRRRILIASLWLAGCAASSALPAAGADATPAASTTPAAAASVTPPAAAVAQPTPDPITAHRSAVAKARSDEADADSKRVGVYTAIADALNKVTIGVVLPLVLIWVFVTRLPEIGKFLSTRAWNATLPGGFVFSAQQAAAVVTNTATAPTAADLHVASAVNAGPASGAKFKLLEGGADAAAPASGELAAFLARIRQTILQSQLALLRGVAGGGVTVGRARAVYAAAPAAHAIPFDEWLGYLTRFQLLAADAKTIGDARTLHLTSVGTAFLASVDAHPLEAELTATGRTV